MPRLVPHPPHAGAEIDTPALSRSRAVAGLLRNYRPYGAIEEAEQRLRDEPAPRRKDMAIAVSPLAMREETLRHKEVQFVAGTRHCDVKKPTLLLDFGCCAGGEIGGDAPVDHIQHEHRAPFLSLGGMNGGKDQIVFI